MTETTPHARGNSANPVFEGLIPTATFTASSRRKRSPKRVLFSTVPIVLVGSLVAMTLNLTAPAEPVSAKPKLLPSESSKFLRSSPQAAATPTVEGSINTAATPETYTVAPGDTISEIAGRYGLSTASVLALNGLSWSSMIYPDQQLKLTNSGALPPIAAVEAVTQSSRYTIVAGDTISNIAERLGIAPLLVLQANGLSWESIIYPGQTLAIPHLANPGATKMPAEEQTRVDGLPDAELASQATPLKSPGPAGTHTVGPGSTYTIESGDTISGIATRFSLSDQALLDANGLSASSLIFSGETITIPSVSPAAGTIYAGDLPVTGLNDEMRANALVIIEVGRELGVPHYGIIIALATAMQESSLRNLDWGDRDSLGLFQQRPSSGWGSADQLTTPSHAARLFFGGPGNPNAGHTRGLLDETGWESLPLTVAAQRVQISAYPDAYARWETSARSWLAELG
jgi:LysM repeat protein